MDITNFTLNEVNLETTLKTAELIAAFEYEHNDGDQIWTDTTEYYKKDDSYESIYTEGYLGVKTTRTVTLDFIKMRMEEIQQEVDKKAKAIETYGSNHVFTRGGYSILKPLGTEQKKEDIENKKMNDSPCYTCINYRKTDKEAENECCTCQKTKFTDMSLKEAAKEIFSNFELQHHGAKYLI